MDATTTGCFEHAVLLPRPVLRVSYDEDLDFLCALVAGEAIDQHLDDETQPLAAMDDESEEEIAWLFTRGPGGPLIGFGIARAFEWPVADEPDDAPIWHGPRFDVPTLALRDASIGEILLAAQTTITGSTTDVCLFDAAIAAKEDDGDLEKAEAMWRGCLEVGEMRAHFGLGYTLCDLGRPAEAFGHLAMYTEICPRNSWAWVWRGRAARDMGELAEARTCFQTAIHCEDEYSAAETDAGKFLSALDATQE